MEFLDGGVVMPEAKFRIASIALEETDTSFQIAWPGSYRFDGPAFVHTDRHSRRVSTILGYPTHLLAKD